MKKDNFLQKIPHKFHKMSGAQILALGYLIAIVVGSILLSLPQATKGHIVTPYVDALFTSTSATCVTGLVVYDTFSYWSVFGQLVILCLIQIGGIGFMTFIALISLFLNRNIGLFERKVLMVSSNSMGIDGVVTLIKRILIITLLCEVAGAGLLFIRFYPVFGVGQGLYYSIFHSISAFCNAGFDLMGVIEPYSSFIYFKDDLLVNFTLMALIIIGGLGFVVWSNIWETKLNFKKCNLHTKVVIISTSILIIIPAILFLIFEYNNAYAGDSFWTALRYSLFQSISPRTCGMNSISLNSLSQPSVILTTALMFIGGNSGSTAGGIKVTTIVVLLLSGIASARNKSNIEIFKRQIDNKIVSTASSIVIIYIMFVFVGVLLISATQSNIPFISILFEVVSAISTTGLSLGITPNISTFAKILLVSLMYVGRLGAFTFALAFIEKQQPPTIKRPTEKIVIG